MSTTFTTSLRMFAAGIVATGLLLAAGSTVSAQSGPGKSALAVSPAIIEQVLDRGKPSTRTVRLTNTTRVPLPIKASTKSLTPIEEITQSADKAIYDASSWFTITPADFILQPNETKEISVQINTPAAATPGGHYATVYFQPLVPREALSPTSAYLSARVGTLAFMVVRGDISERATTSGIEVTKIMQFGPADISVPVTNTGNVHLSPRGNVDIYDFRGERIKTLPLPPGMVLPGTMRTYALKWDNAGQLGRFTAKANITYGTDETTLKTPPVTFWIVPWIPLVAGLVLGTGLLLLVIRTRGRWRAAWRVLRSGNSST